MTDDEVKRWIATYNDQVEFYCGRKIFDPENIVWKDYFSREYFDPRLFAECIREYFESGGTYDREMIGSRLRGIYGKHIGERKTDSAGRCPCQGHKIVWVLTDRNEKVVNFRYDPPEVLKNLRLANVCNAPCPFCGEVEPKLREQIKAAYMPMKVRNGSNFFPPDWSGEGDWDGKQVIWLWLKYRLGLE